MVLEKRVNFCKKYEAHNKTFWFMYPLLGFELDMAEYVRKVVSKSNLYISDKDCPYNEYTDNMIIYALKYKDYSLEEDRDMLKAYLTSNDKFVYQYKIEGEDVIDCFIFEFKEEKAKIYECFRNGDYSKMDILTSVNVGFKKDVKYGDIFKSFSTQEKEDKYAHKIFHVVKKTDLQKLKFNNWLKHIGVYKYTANDLELESKLNPLEEILRYEY